MWSPICIILSLLIPAARVLSLEFDFVIIGGGTSGLVIANRLSELNVTVAIIEAGASVRDNTNVTRVDGFTLALNTEIDWQYASTNQTYAGGQSIQYHAGKALGGTSTLNGMTYTRAPVAQIDSWEKVGNAGWNWKNLFPYYRKSENFTYPTAAQVSAGASFNPEFHGEDGPLNVGYAYDLINGSIQAEVAASWKALGVKHNRDINGGFMDGYTVAQSTLDREENVREDAARAYYYPVEKRGNLKVFLRTNARRIVWADGDEGAEATARGVEVLLENGDLKVIKARREVIVSAGTLRSPAILEHSGIGNENILSDYNIPTKIHLPGTGENLQDQPNNVLLYEGKETFNGTTPFVTYTPLSSVILTPPSLNLTEIATTLSSALNNTLPIASLIYLLTIQQDLIIRAQIPNVEIILGDTVTIGAGPSNVLDTAFWVLLPFSRGNVHIGSSDPEDHPRINPNFFIIDWDLKVQVAIAQYARRFWAAQPLGSLMTEMGPGYGILARNATEQEWEDWIKSSCKFSSFVLL
ncbi:hypothetical protein ACMFMF_005656 [Clarireedia jacksonii]